MLELVSNCILKVAGDVEPVILKLALTARLDAQVIHARFKTHNDPAFACVQDLAAKLVRPPLVVSTGREVDPAEVNAAVVHNGERHAAVAERPGVRSALQDDAELLAPDVALAVVGA